MSARLIAAARAIVAESNYYSKAVRELVAAADEAAQAQPLRECAVDLLMAATVYRGARDAERKFLAGRRLDEAVAAMTLALNGEPPVPVVVRCTPVERSSPAKILPGPPPVPAAAPPATSPAPVEELAAGGGAPALADLCARDGCGHRHRFHTCWGECHVERYVDDAEACACREFLEPAAEPLTCEDDDGEPIDESRARHHLGPAVLLAGSRPKASITAPRTLPRDFGPGGDR